MRDQNNLGGARERLSATAQEGDSMVGLTRFKSSTCIMMISRWMNITKLIDAVEKQPGHGRLKYQR